MPTAHTGFTPSAHGNRHGRRRRHDRLRCRHAHHKLLAGTDAIGHDDREALAVGAGYHQLRAGAHAVGFVAPLFDAEAVAAGRWDVIESRARTLLDAVRSA